MIKPEIKTIDVKKLIGKKVEMSMIENKTMELWKSFMPRRNEIKNAINSDLISMQIFEKDFDFENFNPHNKFTKWATIEVENFENIPKEMQTITIPTGLYAVFYYKGLDSNPAIFKYIFGTWIPASIYKIDNRPHFEILGEKYKRNDENSEEEIWIPIQPKN